MSIASQSINDGDSNFSDIGNNCHYPKDEAGND